MTALICSMHSPPSSLYFILYPHRRENRNKGGPYTENGRGKHGCVPVSRKYKRKRRGRRPSCVALLYTLHLLLFLYADEWGRGGGRMERGWSERDWYENEAISTFLPFLFRSESPLPPPHLHTLWPRRLDKRGGGGKFTARRRRRRRRTCNGMPISFMSAGAASVLRGKNTRATTYTAKGEDAPRWKIHNIGKGRGVEAVYLHRPR